MRCPESLDFLAIGRVGEFLLFPEAGRMEEFLLFPEIGRMEEFALPYVRNILNYGSIIRSFGRDEVF